MKLDFVITSLLLVFAACTLMIFRNTYAFNAYESFQAGPVPNLPSVAASMSNTQPRTGGNAQNAPNMGIGAPVKEGFSSYFLENAAGNKDSYQSIGAYDGVTLPTGNKVSSWRYTAPDEKLLGDEFVPGDDSLFMFKNNQCKPECCGASFSCGGGCVCTTPSQRQYLAGRGGNRTAPEDSA